LAAALAFAAFLGSGDVSFLRDFFFAVFGFGVGLADFFDFREAAVGSGVSLGFGLGVVSSSSLESFAEFRFAAGCGDSCGLRDAAVSLVDSSVANFALRIGGDSSGVAEGLRFFFDFFAAALAFGIALGDFSGVGDETTLVSCCFSPDSFR
jgi:hypothetical protein